jgi:hypothetical protein
VLATHFEVSIHRVGNLCMTRSSEELHSLAWNLFSGPERPFTVEFPCATAESASMAHNIGMLAGQQDGERSVDLALSTAFSRDGAPLTKSDTAAVPDTV